jgi:hypothetical protein
MMACAAILSDDCGVLAHPLEVVPTKGQFLMGTDGFVQLIELHPTNTLLTCVSEMFRFGDSVYVTAHQQRLKPIGFWSYARNASPSAKIRDARGMAVG